MNTPHWVKSALAERQQQSLLRKTTIMEIAQPPETNVGGTNYLAFCSNDYLGLANHPDLIKALHDSALEYGVGSGASHLVSGHNRLHQMLEEELADWLGYEKVLLFSAGYMANLGVISALAQSGSFIVQDKLNHASLIDGATLSGATLRRYLHTDLSSVERVLTKTKQQDNNSSNLLVTDGVFSMDGDIAPLQELSILSKEHNAILVVDDAHGLGCCGAQGKGAMELEKVDSHAIPLLIGTFGKAFGAAGAFVATTHDIADYLTQFARPYIYTTAMSPAMAGMVRSSLAILRGNEGDELRAKLAHNIALFRDKVKGLPIGLGDSNTAIQPLIVDSSKDALLLSEKLKQRGIWCTAIRPPTVPSARLRITLSASHTSQHIETFTQTLAALLD